MNSAPSERYIQVCAQVQSKHDDSETRSRKENAELLEKSSKLSSVLEMDGDVDVI